MDVDVPVKETAKVADTEMQEPLAARKREREPQSEADSASESDPTKQLLAFMREQAEQAKKDSAQKDLHISELLKRIEQLSNEVASLRTS